MTGQQTGLSPAGAPLGSHPPGRRAVRNRTPVVAAALSCSLLAWLCLSVNAQTSAIEIATEDVERFFNLYDASAGRPTAAQIEREYLARGSAGLRHLARVRSVTGERIAQAIDADPALYINARSCIRVLPRVRTRLERSFERLLEFYPAAQRPPVTILVSRGRPLAIAGPGDGVQIAAEGMCSAAAARVLDRDVGDRFVNVIAHEYIHSQQAPALAGTENLTVLQRSLLEGIAEFVGELISGGIAHTGVALAAGGREKEIETRFAAAIDSKDLSAWVDNTTANDVGQLGYWVGYRIAKSYYRTARDKRAAIREMIEMTDARAFLAASGWSPGIVLN